MSRLQVARSELRLYPDPTRTILKPFVPGQYTVDAGDPATQAVIRRLLALPEAEVEAAFASTHERYAERIPDLRQSLQDGFAGMAGLLDGDVDLSPARRSLIGACFLHEYSIEAAALTNPSIVPAPDQSGVPAGQLRFVLSLRAIGEGHRSSIVFRTGIVDAEGRVGLDAAGDRPVTGALGADGSLAFGASSRLSERVIYPCVADEQNGVEDARFVRFTDDRSASYFATYTAFDGGRIRLRLLATDDFVTFRFADLEGEAAQDKGMALFPRSVGGRYAALSRYDDESNHLVFSDDLRSWDSPVRIQAPKRAWEIVKLGNCGSPIETQAGWLVVTHGVGPLREYSLGAMLLDRDDPSRVLGVLDEPLLLASEEERDGYVPNVVYSCGSLLHAGHLVLPYGFSDRGTSFATVSLQALLDRLSG